jgi:hypothetical protein
MLDFDDLDFDGLDGPSEDPSDGDGPLTPGPGDGEPS